MSQTPTTNSVPTATVLLLHGYPQDSSCWSDVTPRLNAAGLRTLAPDQRGYSPLARPRRVSAYRPGELIADALAVLDAAGVHIAHVVGHDWGGAVAWGLAMVAPERVATLTVLSTPHPAAMSWAMTHSTQGLHSWYMLFFQLPWLPERASAPRMEQMLRQSGLPAAAAQRYAQRFSSPESLTGPLNWYRAMRWRGLVREAADPVVGVPATYLWGRRDPFLARAAALRTARHVTGPYRFVELDAGHWLPETQAERVAEEILTGVAS